MVSDAKAALVSFRMIWTSSGSKRMWQNSQKQAFGVLVLRLSVLAIECEQAENIETYPKY